MSDEAHVAVIGPAGQTELTVPWSTTVGELFGLALSELKLGEGGFELSCADGVTMMNKLERTLQDLRDRRICPTQRFAVKAGRNAFK
ncbi:MAG: hypothetical protein WB682_03720 [Candidatus Dormiibacterota bacterium]